MYQESDDKINGSGKTDTLIFIVLIVFFLFAGTVATVLKNSFNSNIPIYILAAMLAALLYIIYRLRIVGWRYTVFYKEPEAQYDPRFDDYIIHEDYPYPVGTVVIERTVSAKGSVIAVISKEDIVALLDAGAEYSADSEMVCGSRKKELSLSLVYTQNNKKVRLFFNPTEEFKKYLRGVMEK